MSPTIPTHTALLEGKHRVTLYLQGRVEDLTAPSVSVIGTRAPSPQGTDLAQQIGHALSRAGVFVMSGLAKGIDATAMLATLDAKGSLIGVIGTPLHKTYPPEHAGLQTTVATDHLLVSPFAPLTKTEPAHFVFRNRVMAHLSRATVIVEAQAKSGTRAQLSACIRERRPCFIHKATADQVWWASAAVRAGDATVFADVSGLLSMLMRAGLL